MFAAFAVLPFAAALAAFVASPVLWSFGARSRPSDPCEIARGFAMLTGVLALMVTLGGAVPVVFWLIRRGRVIFGLIAAAGLALGNAPFVAYLLVLLPFAVMHVVQGTMAQRLLPLSELVAGTLRAVFVGSTVGLFSAVAFWFVGIRGTER